MTSGHGLKLVKDAKNILVSKDEVKCAKKHSFVRYQSSWWQGVDMREFEWNFAYGPAGKAYDLFNDQSVLLVSIPGHADGLFVVKITNMQGKFVLLVSDGGYAKKSWSEMITSGIALDRVSQRKSLEWIRMVSEDANCVGVFATHDADVKPCVVEI